MVPAGVVDRRIAELAPRLRSGRHPDRRRQLLLPRRHPPRRRAAREGASTTSTCGVSGGVWGLERGYCLMIGGDDEAVQRLDPIFASLAPGIGDADAHAGPRRAIRRTAEQGYLHCGPNGAGHFVKMVHNGIEYGVMAAYAEGLNILTARQRRQGRRSEVDAETTPLRDPELLPVRPRPRRGRRGVAARQRDRLVAARSHRDRAARETPTLATSPAACRTPARAAGRRSPRSTRPCRRRSSPRALFERFSSRGEADFADKVLSAMRFEFGGHHEKPV